CSREERAGSLAGSSDGITFPHRATGNCACGRQHGAAGVARNYADRVHRIAATYDYRHADGQLAFQVVRMQPKGFRQRRPDGNGGWIWNLKNVDRILYKLPELLHSNGEIVFVPEGERDVDRLRNLGLVATCNAGGAGKWRSEYGVHLKGRRVVVLPDNDDVGRQHAKQVTDSIAGVASDVRVLELPDLRKHGDVSDWLDAGHAVDELLQQAATPPAALAGTASLLDQVHD